MRKLFRRWVLARPWLTFVVMGLSFLAFGAGTLNLIYLFQANARFIAEQGWRAVMDGALLQLVELVVTGTVSMAAYVVFKTCEHRLSRWLGDEQ
ncbi:MAG: hypothetical protein M3544_03870 [Pseudomonadota bacterium]|nr:hypothetical protein [Pseudomonadota bacterium]